MPNVAHLCQLKLCALSPGRPGDGPLSLKLTLMECRSAWHDPSRITTEVWEGYLKPLQADNWDRALWELTRASGSHNLEEQLAEIQMPCLVITGDDAASYIC